MMNNLGSPHSVEGAGDKRDRLSGTADYHGAREGRVKDRSHSCRRLTSNDASTAEPGEGVAEPSRTGTKVKNPTAGRRQVRACCGHPPLDVSRTKTSAAIVASRHLWSIRHRLVPAPIRYMPLSRRDKAYRWQRVAQTDDNDAPQSILPGQNPNLASEASGGVSAQPGVIPAVASVRARQTRSGVAGMSMWRTPR